MAFLNFLWMLERSDNDNRHNVTYRAGSGVMARMYTGRTPMPKVDYQQ